MNVVGLIEHDPRQGTLFAGCEVRKLGLATFEVLMQGPKDILLVRMLWPTHSVMVVQPPGAPDTVRHIVTYAPVGKPHVSPACPFTAQVICR